MKKTLVLALAVGMAFTATSAMATIVGSKHDLSSSGASAGYGTDVQNRICVYCHHPHNSAKAGTVDGIDTLAYSPLWNREWRADRDGDGTSDFTAYDNGTNMSNGATYANSTVGKHMLNGVPKVGGVSLLCLSCHDGVTALGAYSSQGPDTTGSFLTPTDIQAASGGNAVVTGVAALGVDLSNHHPIGMIWQDVVDNDNEIAPDTTLFNGTSISIKSVLTGGTTMECSSCHDVHNGTGAERFLWTSNQDGSKFCLSCHLK